ncbi:MAG TPA: hypothetical protein VL860_01505 [Planctomycetota bacterium]|nr:hypothetical protein [Planctomycetota bacterium]
MPALCAALLLCSVGTGLAALDEPQPAYEKGLYDWTGNDWGLQHHVQAMGVYDDNPRRQSYSSHPLPDFATRFDYGLVLGKYLDRFHYVRVDYDAQAWAWARYGDLNTVDHTLAARMNYFDPQIDVTGYGWFAKPRALVAVRKAPEDFIANAAPRRMETDLALPLGYRFDTLRLELGPTYRQTRFLEPGFDVLDSRDIGGYAELEQMLRTDQTAWYGRIEYRSVDRRRPDLFNNFSAAGLRIGWRQHIAGTLRSDIGLDADLFSRLSNRAADGTPATALNLSPFIDLTWQPDPEATTVEFSLRRRFEPDTAVSAGAFTTANVHLTQMVVRESLDVGLGSRMTVNNRLGGGSATVFSLKADANFHYGHADWPPLTIIVAVGIDLNRSDLPGSSYQSRTATIGCRAVF